MYYFVKKDNLIEKYEVTYDKEEMEKLRIEIINKCSEIEHLEYESTDGPTYNDDLLHIRNLEIVKTGVKKYNDFYSADEDIFHYSYDYYDYPYLVNLINLLSMDNVHALHSILNPDYSNEKEPIDLRIKKVTQKLNRIVSTKNKNKSTLLSELQELIEKAELNENQISVKEYYPKVQELIHLKLFDTIEISELERIKSFFKISIDNIAVF